LVLHFDLVLGLERKGPRVVALQARRGCRNPHFVSRKLGVGPYAKSYRHSHRGVY
jgi:hypothetical protein